MDCYTQNAWENAIANGDVVEIRDPYYRINDEIRKMADSKEDARTKFELTPEQEASPDDAIIIDPMPEREVCREIVLSALDEHVQAEAQKILGVN